MGQGLETQTINCVENILKSEITKYLDKVKTLGYL